MSGRVYTSSPVVPAFLAVAGNSLPYMPDDVEGFIQNKGLKSGTGCEDKSNFSYFLIEASIMKSRLDLHSSLFS